MEEQLDTFPRLLRHHASVRPAHPATREKSLGIWQSWIGAGCRRGPRAGLRAGGAGFRRGMHLAIIGDNRPRLYWSMCSPRRHSGADVPGRLIGRSRVRP